MRYGHVIDMQSLLKYLAGSLCSKTLFSFSYGRHC